MHTIQGGSLAHVTFRPNYQTISTSSFLKNPGGLGPRCSSRVSNAQLGAVGRISASFWGGFFLPFTLLPSFTLFTWGILLRRLLGLSRSPTRLSSSRNPQPRPFRKRYPSRKTRRKRRREKEGVPCGGDPARKMAHQETSRCAPPKLPVPNAITYLYVEAGR
ncbi:hypothetical protein F5X99DRAFT_389763 [Biscogniauxia marginata]|nr:hypothetical protein F5X99DRAFT_389763 [Biscogniauxia marginata]